VRIPTFTIFDKKGYIEDRRPASNLDPYVACAAMVDAACLEESSVGDMMEAFREWTEWKKGITFEK
jgi:glutamine synthetase